MATKELENSLNFNMIQVKSIRDILMGMAILFPFLGQAQDSSGCRLIRETDPYTKEVKLSSGFIGLDGASVTIDADSKEVIFLFSIEAADKCFDNNATVDLFFEVIKSKTMSRNAGTMNCEGLFQLVFKNSNSNPTTVLQRLTSRKLTHMIFTGNSKKPITVNLGPKEQEAFMFLANCVLTQGRSLIR
jgi:hypothetical protein